MFIGIETPLMCFLHFLFPTKTTFMRLSSSSFSFFFVLLFSLLPVCHARCLVFSLLHAVKPIDSHFVPCTLLVIPRLHTSHTITKSETLPLSTGRRSSLHHRHHHGGAPKFLQLTRASSLWPVSPFSSFPSRNTSSSSLFPCPFSDSPPFFPSPYLPSPSLCSAVVHSCLCQLASNSFLPLISSRSSFSFASHPRLCCCSLLPKHLSVAVVCCRTKLLRRCPAKAVLKEEEKSSFYGNRPCCSLLPASPRSRKSISVTQGEAQDTSSLLSSSPSYLEKLCSSKTPPLLRTLSSSPSASSPPPSSASSLSVLLLLTPTPRRAQSRSLARDNSTRLCLPFSSTPAAWLPQNKGSGFGKKQREGRFQFSSSRPILVINTSTRVISKRQQPVLASVHCSSEDKFTACSSSSSSSSSSAKEGKIFKIGIEGTKKRRTEEKANKKLFAHLLLLCPSSINKYKTFRTATLQHVSPSFFSREQQRSVDSTNVLLKDKYYTQFCSETGPATSAFLLLDLIKIFGRLSEPSSVGSVIASPLSSPAGVASDVLSVYERLLRLPSTCRKLRKADASSRGEDREAKAAALTAADAYARTAAAAAAKKEEISTTTSKTTATADERAQVIAALETWLARERARWRYSTYESLLVQGSKNVFMGREKIPKKRKWDRLFTSFDQQRQQPQQRKLPQLPENGLVRDRVLGLGLTRQAFETHLLQLPFAWPLLPNTGALPGTIPYQPAAFEEFLTVCGSTHERNPAALNPIKHGEGGRCRIPQYERVNALLQRDPIHKEAIDCVWRAFTTLFHGPFGEVLPAAQRSAETRLLPPALLEYQKSICQIRYLYRGDILRCIWQWAPADGFVDWNSFVFFLDEIPADGINNMID